MIFRPQYLTFESNITKKSCKRWDTIRKMSDQDYSVIVLYPGYSYIDTESNIMKANCSCTLIKGPNNIIVDTMTPWDGERILTALNDHNLKPDDINFVICTHGHADHIGNNNLFLEAKHIVGSCVNRKDEFPLDAFGNGSRFIIDDKVHILQTPGHTHSDVSVIVNTPGRTWVIAGDLFERLEDIDEPNLWLDAGSEIPEIQKANRYKMAFLADWIVPGHGPAFECTEIIRQKLHDQIK